MKNTKKLKGINILIANGIQAIRESTTKHFIGSEAKFTICKL